MGLIKKNIFFKEIGLRGKIGEYTLLVHKKQNYFILEASGKTFCLIGHTYNPFSREYKESEILSNITLAYKKGKKEFFDK